MAWCAALVPALLLQGAASFAWHLGIHETEELYNAAHAALVLAAGPELLLPLQYQPFCGGCTVDAGLGALSFAVLGPSIAAWRLVGFAWFALALVSACSLAERFGGRRALLGCGLLFAFAPPAYQELGLILNGNHPEGGALLVAQLAVGAVARDSRRPWAWLFLQGVLVGFGLYLVRSLVLGGVGLGLALLLARSVVAVPAAAGGVLLGALPLLGVREVFGAWPTEPIYQQDEWRLSVAWVVRNAQTLFSPVQLRGIWGDATLGWLSWLGVPAFAAWAALASRGRNVLLTGTLAAFTGLYLLFRLAVWMDGEQPPFAQQVRYLGVVYPVALASAGCGLARGRWPWAVAALFVVPGAVTRTHVLAGPWTAWERKAPAHAFLAERARGPAARLDAASVGSPYDLAAVAVGRLETEPGYFVPYMKDEGTSLRDRDDLDNTSLRYGRTLGALVAADGAEQRALAAANGGAELVTATVDAWLLRDAGVVDALAELPEPPGHVQARLAWSLARGRMIGRSCVREEPADQPVRVVVHLGQNCPIEPHEQESERWLAFGVGAWLGERAGATLAELELDPALQRRGVEQGLAWARDAAWLTERLPEVAIRGSSE